MKIHKIYHTFRRIVRLKKQKKILITTFQLEQLIHQYDISNAQAKEYGIIRHNRRVALRLFYLYEHVDV